MGSRSHLVGAIGMAVSALGCILAWDLYCRELLRQATVEAARLCNGSVGGQSCEDATTAAQPDPWGRRYLCSVVDGGLGFESFGRDGERGGIGSSADLLCTPDPSTAPTRCYCSLEERPPNLRL